ncbi:hypothetical protein LMH87_009472 [Akanthomyces muscarius]|uniref:Uncharacterized protein n=1 Tax=Akanthomyces muscarius TaxID=2231603 RepID=A0A9W8QC54_AKAMU|nr:hypothetical protein LMH87_009472 [Akanthomyces muscarius]KAJ4152955.1 hypothetical protein LMH87_009472 [Akanthomyces muscarius]
MFCTVSTEEQLFAESRDAGTVCEQVSWLCCASSNDWVNGLGLTLTSDVALPEKAPCRGEGHCHTERVQMANATQHVDRSAYIATQLIRFFSFS